MVDRGKKKMSGRGGTSVESLGLSGEGCDDDDKINDEYIHVVVVVQRTTNVHHAFLSFTTRNATFLQ